MIEVNVATALMVGLFLSFFVIAAKKIRDLIDWIIGYKRNPEPDPVKLIKQDVEYHQSIQGMFMRFKPLDRIDIAQKMIEECEQWSKKDINQEAKRWAILAEYASSLNTVESIDRAKKPDTANI